MTNTHPTTASSPASRPPIVAVLGHVDHGKSSLLDYIRKTNVVGKEAGGITQHLGAYEVAHATKEGAKRGITFLDTPGHEAFKGIRERGARVADVAILVVSGEEGVKPQTVEALSFIKKEKLPYVVAITKIDKPTADAERVKQSLAEHEIYLEGYGGDTPCVALSSKTGAGVAELLDVLLLLADLTGIATNPATPVKGFIIESSVSMRDGVSATALITEGTLAKGAFVVSEGVYAPTRRFSDVAGNAVKEIPAGRPVRIFGWSALPRVGATLSTAKNKREAEVCADEYAGTVRQKKPVAGASEPEKACIPLIIKADTTGSLEALEHEVWKQQTDKVRVQILQRGIGPINEGDAKSAAGAANALILGFNVETDAAAKQLIERDRLTVISSDVIYRFGERLAEKVSERTPKEKVEEVTGGARILKLFGAEKDRQIVGGKVLEGELAAGNEFRVWRREAKVGAGKIRELQHQKQKIASAPKDSEFGALVNASVEILPGDRLETFRIIER